MKGTFCGAKETTPLRKYHYSNQYTQNIWQKKTGKLKDELDLQ